MNELLLKIDVFTNGTCLIYAVVTVSTEKNSDGENISQYIH